MKSTIIVASLAASLGAPLVAEPVSFRLHGQAWTELGRVMESSRMRFGDTPDSVDVSGSPLQSTGGQLVVDAALSEKLSASIGIGVRQISNSVGTFITQGEENYSPYAWSFTTYRGYVAQANLTYTEGGEFPWLQVTAGTFSHVYNRDAHNLGAYLLRGPVYPGLLVSGFQQFELDPAKATKVGLRVHHAAGAFSHDLLFLNEHELPPTFDWSLAYIAKVRPHPALEVGAGANFHRLIPYARRLNEVEYSGSLEPSGDTVTYTHQGIKLMGMFSLDLKTLLALDGMGDRDLRLYGEAALLGVKNHGAIYDDPMERLPVMVGFNFPTFGFLDRLSVEGEWYGSPYRNDLYNIGNPEGMVAPWRWNPLRPSPSPVPVEGVAKDDDWRWSVLLEKSLTPNVRLTAQAASDHYRPLPYSTELIIQPGGTGAAFASPSEWYFMARLGFFF